MTNIDEATNETSSINLLEAAAEEPHISFVLPSKTLHLLSNRMKVETVEDLSTNAIGMSPASKPKATDAASANSGGLASESTKPENGDLKRAKRLFHQISRVIPDELLSTDDEQGNIVASDSDSSADGQRKRPRILESQELSRDEEDGEIDDVLRSSDEESDVFVPEQQPAEDSSSSSAASSSGSGSPLHNPRRSSLKTKPSKGRFKGFPTCSATDEKTGQPCKKRAVTPAAGLCRAHGGGKCLAQDCDSAAARRSNYCLRHGDMGRCQATTQNGQQCSKQSQGKTRFCIRHGGGQRCMATQEDGSSCSRAAASGSYLCVRHGGGKRCKGMDGDTPCKKGAEHQSDFCFRHGGGKRCTAFDDKKGATCGRKAVFPTERLCLLHGVGLCKAKEDNDTPCKNFAKTKRGLCKRHDPKINKK